MTWPERLQALGSVLRDPVLLDGAAYEYCQPPVQEAFRKLLEESKPDLVWFEFTYSWPLIRIAKARGLRCLMRSVNFESLHYLEEYGRSPLNLLKYVPKVLGDRRAARWCDKLLAITPDEASRYRKLGAKDVTVLPLRGLPDVLAVPKSGPRAEGPLRVLFSAGTFNVPHNRRDLEFVVREIAPRVEAAAPGAFMFHVTGKKVDESLKASVGKNVRFEGFIKDYAAFILGMDAAVTPSLSGAGMQQKVFEPLCRKLPLVVSTRGLAGYPFVDGEHCLTASGADDFAAKLVSLRDDALRNRLAENAYALARKMFSRETSDAIIKAALAPMP